MASVSEEVFNDTIIDMNSPVPESKLSTSWHLDVSSQPRTSRQSASTSLTFSPADILSKPHVIRKTVLNAR